MAELITVSCGNVSTTIDSMGAQMMSLKLGDAEYLWQGDERWWPRRSPVLFPIVGNIRNDVATSAQGEIHFGRHGIARSCEFAVEEALESEVTFLLCSNDETRASFPYDFELRLTYTAGEKGVTQGYKVTNTGDVPLPFTLGGHPAFNVPAPGADDAFEDYRLQFTQPWTYSSPTIEGGLWNLDHQMPLLDNSDNLPLNHRIFDVDTLMFVEVPDRSVKLVGTSGHGVQLNFPGFDYLGVWSAANDAPFVAVEPWIGCATCSDESDVFEEKRGTVTLQPGESASFAFEMLPF